jgi:nicotinamide-nucleotide amidase
MARRLGPDLYGADDATLASVVGARLAALGRTVATAESCTGGLLGAELTTVPGSSS